MQYMIPDYYNEFNCIADACPDTCCAGWQIVIDEKSKRKYRKYPGAFGKRLKQSIDWKEGVFCQQKKRCAFLNDKNLCDLYIEAGKHMLCETCRKYPRHIEEYEDLREISLSISCPVVAKMLIHKRDKVRFVSKERTTPVEEYEEFDYMLFTKLCDARELMIEIMQTRNVSVWTRMAMILSLGHDLQRRINQGQLFEVDTLLERYSASGAIERFEKRREQYENCAQGKASLLEKMYTIFRELEVLKEDFPRYLEERILGKDVEENGGLISEEEAIWLEQIVIYFLFTYFCGAVYDEMAYVKVKFAVVSTILIRQIYLGDARWKKERSTQAVIEAAYRYAREVEHSDLNLLQIEKILEQKKEYGITNLLKVIWGPDYRDMRYDG